MSEPLYMHIEANGSRVTAAITVEDEVALVGLSFCSPQDQFCRSKGRLIATNRLKKGKHFFSLPLNADKRLGIQVREALAASIKEEYEKLPFWLGGTKRS